MTDDELKALKKAASSKKRVATEWASRIHDVVEDTYWADYHSLPDLAAEAVAACEAWKEAQAVYDQAKSGAETA